MINLVVVAGGKQTRFKELSIFPKVLLPSIESCSLLKEFVDKTQDESQTINRFIVINKTYSKQLQNYIKVNGLDEKIKIIESTNTNGSFNTLQEVRDQLPKNDVLFVWSDLAITSYQDIFKLCTEDQYDGIIFTNSAGKYRYGASRYSLDDPRINLLDQIYVSSSYDGNIPGVYFLKTTNVLFHNYEDSAQRDLIDAINDDFKFSCGNDKTYRVVDFAETSSKLVEYKDLGTYIDYMRNNIHIDQCQTRFFNKLVIDRDSKLATKKAIDEAYVHLIKKEMEWYQTVNHLSPNASLIPKIESYGEREFTMEFLDTYKPLHVVLDELESKSDVASIAKLYKNIFRRIEECGKIQTARIELDQFREDVKKEIYDKVIERCEKIKDILVNYNKDDLKKVLSRAVDVAMEFGKNGEDYDEKTKTIKYYFCHGDLNGSNVMVDPTTFDVKFLDPRGYFGNTKMYGWKPYEYAKILYCLYGYDDFNLNPQIYFRDWPKLRPSLEYSNFKLQAGQRYEDYIVLVGVIYVALAGYISQDVMKANIAYDYGMKLLNWRLNED